MEDRKEISYEEAMKLRKDSVEKMKNELEMLEIEAKYYSLIESIEVSNFNRFQVQMQKAQMMFAQKQQEQNKEQDNTSSAKMEVVRED